MMHAARKHVASAPLLLPLLLLLSLPPVAQALTVTVAPLMDEVHYTFVFNVTLDVGDAELLAAHNLTTDLVTLAFREMPEAADEERLRDVLYQDPDVLLFSAAQFDSVLGGLLFTYAHRIFTNTSGAQGLSGQLPACGASISPPCVELGRRYGVTATISSTGNTGNNDAPAALSSAETVVAALPEQFFSVSALTCGNVTSSSAFLSWQLPAPLTTGGNVLLHLEITVRYEFLGDAPLLERYQRKSSVLKTIVVQGLHQDEATNTFTLTGCLLDSVTNTTHCIAPYTVYQVDVAAVGSRFSTTATTYCLTDAGLQPNPPSTPLTYQIEKEQFLLGVFPPKPFTGPLGVVLIVWQAIGWNESGQLVTFAVPRYNADVAGDPRDGQLILPVTGLQPYTQYMLLVSFMVGPGFGPLWPMPLVRTAETIPNIIAAPIITSISGGTQVNVCWTPPLRPPGPINRFELTNDQDVVFSYEGNETCADLELGRAGKRLSVRACTYECGPYSEGSVVPQPNEPSSSSFTKEAVIGGTVGLVTLLVIIVLALLLHRRHVRQLKQAELAFVYPAADEWHVDRTQVQLGAVLGSGAFGVVHAGTLTKADERKRVAVKICESEQVMDRREFVQEADLMKKLSKPGHENVLALLGVHLQSSPLMVVLEYANAGDLKNFLNDCAPNERRVASLSPRDLVSIMLDITSGMNHLIKLHGFVHRDLAARNCLVFENVDKITVKIADFGLSRDVHYLQYYRKTGKALLPIRWMSPEAMVDGRFSSASDVWSFGVLSWEIWTFGQTPYGAHSPTEIFDLVIKGYRLSKPNCCPKAILILMSSCWNLSPAERPSFAELVEFLAKEINLVETARVQNVSMSDALDTANSQTEGNKGGQANQPAAKADNKPSGNGYSTLVLCAVGNTATSKNHTEV